MWSSHNVKNPYIWFLMGKGIKIFRHYRTPYLGTDCIPAGDKAQDQGAVTSRLADGIGALCKY